MAKKKTNSLVPMEERAKAIIDRAKSLILVTEQDRTGAQQFYKDAVQAKNTFADMYDDEISKAHKLWKSIIAKRDSFVKPLEEAAKLVKAKIGEYDENKKRERQIEEAKARQKAIDDEMERRREEAQYLPEDEREEFMNAPMTFAPIVLPDETPKGIVFREIWDAEVLDLMELVRAVATDQALMQNINKLCQLICNSPPETPIKGEIESLAFYIGHHPDVLNVGPPVPLEALLPNPKWLRDTAVRDKATMNVPGCRPFSRRV